MRGVVLARAAILHGDEELRALSCCKVLVARCTRHPCAAGLSPIADVDLTRDCRLSPRMLWGVVCTESIRT